MFILLPHRNQTLRKVIAEIEKEKKLENIFISLWSRKLDSLTIPKFTIKREHKLNAFLIRMGMNVAFSNGADFSRISDKHLKISRAFHKAMIEISEEGIHAATSSSVAMILRSRSHLLLNFTVDRPFVFLIRDRSNQITLFSGIINKL